MMYDDYVKLYKQAKIVRENVIGQQIEKELTISDMLLTINRLKLKLKDKEKEVNELYIYRDKFHKLKELIWTFPSTRLLAFYLE